MGEGKPRGGDGTTRGHAEQHHQQPDHRQLDHNSTKEDDSTNSHTEEHPAKEDAKTHTGVHKTLSGTHDSPKGLTGALKTITSMLKALAETRDSSKALTGVRKTITRMLGTRDQDEGNDSTKTPTRVLKTPTGTHHGMEDSGIRKNVMTLSKRNPAKRRGGRESLIGTGRWRSGASRQTQTDTSVPRTATRSPRGSSSR